MTKNCSTYTEVSMASILKTLFLWAQSFVNDALLIWNRNQVLPFSVIMMMSFWMKHDDNNSMAFTSNSKEDEDGHNTIQPTGITPCQEHPTLNQPESILESQPSPMRKRVFDCITCWRKNDTSKNVEIKQFLCISQHS